MDNHEEILDALTAFGKNPNPQEIPSVLEQYLNSVAKNGETLFPWSQLKPLILRKMELVIMELRRNLASENIPTRPNVENVRFDVIHARIIDSLHKFNGAPFTIQRLCELLIDPKRHYKRSDKFMRGLEKNVLVVSTVDPFGRKVVSELSNKPVLNGILDINGSYPSRDSALSVPLPPVPGWVNTTAVANRSPTGMGSASAMSSSAAAVGGNGPDMLGKDTDCVVSNSSGTQVFSDPGGPLAVHSEEVIEETVVTMETGEASSVVTDGGEALADRDMEAGDDIEDRDASSSFSSSSSSSSEELSTSSDSVETGLRLGMATSNSVNEVTAMDENRPWAAFAQDTKQQQDDLGPTSMSSSSNIPVLGEASGVTSSSSQHNNLSSSLPKETQSTTLLSATTTCSSKEERDSRETPGGEDIPTSQQSRSSDQTNWQQDQQQQESSSCDESLSLSAAGLEPSTTTSTDLATSPQNTVDVTPSPADNSLISSSTSNSVIHPTPATATVTTTTNNNSNSNTDPIIHTSSSSLTGVDATASNEVVPPQPTYAQVVASSTTDKTSSSSVPPLQHISPFGSTIEPVPCDSVAGLERLVGSMEQTLSSSSSSSSTPSSFSAPCPSSTSSSPSSSSQPTNSTSQSNSSSVTTSSSQESLSIPIDPILQNNTPAPSSSTQQCISTEEGEPASKRPRLSMDEVSMEEDCISTSGDTCIAEERNRPAGEDKSQQGEKEVSASVHSSCAEEGKEEQRGQQAESMDREDVPMEEGEGVVTTGSSETPSSECEYRKKSSCDIESTSGDGSAVVDAGDGSVSVGAEIKSDSSNDAESADVSTTDGEDNENQTTENGCE